MGIKNGNNVIEESINGGLSELHSVGCRKEKQNQQQN